MATPKSTVKSAARVERARALIADLPRDPVTGRIQKRATGHVDPPAGPSPAANPPAGGPAAAVPFGQPGRGLRRFRRRTSA